MRLANFKWQIKVFLTFIYERALFVFTRMMPNVEGDAGPVRDRGREREPRRVWLSFSYVQQSRALSGQRNLLKRPHIATMPMPSCLTNFIVEHFSNEMAFIELFLLWRSSTELSRLSLSGPGPFIYEFEERQSFRRPNLCAPAEWPLFL